VKAPKPSPTWGLFYALPKSPLPGNIFIAASQPENRMGKTTMSTMGDDNGIFHPVRVLAFSHRFHRLYHCLFMLNFSLEGGGPEQLYSMNY
jgi:hypothetical protein